MAVQVITMSTKGQIVLPSEMRESMGLVSGCKIAAFSDGGVIILKPISIPTADDFKAELAKAQEWARDVNLTEQDARDAISEARTK